MVKDILLQSDIFFDDTASHEDIAPLCYTMPRLPVPKEMT